MHMLRHLRDPAALRRNELVGHLFSRARTEVSPRRAMVREAARLRQLVQHAAEALRDDATAGDDVHRLRQYEIVLRCDLGNESRDEVMHGLGISRRQFYRDRNAACAYIAEYIANETRRIERPPAVATDLFAAGLACARNLRHIGETQSCDRMLRELLSSPAPARKKVAAWTTLIDLLSDDSRGEDAARELREFRNYGRSHSESSLTAMETSRITALLEPSVLWALGDERAALDADIATGEALSAISRSMNDITIAFAVKSHLSRAQRAFFVGDYAGSHGNVGQAGELMDRCGDLPLALRLQYLLMDGDRKVFSPGRLAEAHGLFAEAARLAQEHGYLEYLSIALGDLALYAQTYGDLEGATRHAKDSMALARRGAPTAIRGHVLLHSAELAFENGQARRSIELAVEAQECFPDRGIGASVSWYHIARGRLLSHAYSGALEAAETLRRIASAGNNQRMLGSGLRLLAQAYHGLGEMRGALEHIDEAISVLQRFGQPFSLRAAYLTSANITGRAEHKRMASEIAASFQLSA